MSNLVGQQLGNYRLIHLLGEGGFAEVYLGEHVHLNTQAAIKVLHTHLVSGDIEQFRNEARTVAHLIHPHIVRVLDFGVEDKVPFLVMDYAPNGTLRQKHPKGTRASLDAIVSYIKQVAPALQYAHDHRLIHRDVKPENMLIGRTNEVLLSDFGIALIAQSSHYQSVRDVAGTIAYMAPEQIASHPSPASDQYSLGIIVYEWLCGERPFSGTFVELAVKHSTVPPPSLREKVPSLSLSAEQVVMKALAKDPKQRFTTVMDFATALEQACQAERKSFSTMIHSQSTAISSPQIPRRSISRRAVVSGLIGLGAIGVGATWLALTIKPHSSEPQAESAVGTTIVTYTGHKHPVYTAAWSHDGRYIASGGNDTTVQIWDTRNGQQLLVYQGHSESVNVVAWSPDPKQQHIIASSSGDQTVQIWDTSNKKVLLIYRDHLSDVRAMSWSPDGTRIASGDANGIVRIWNVAHGQLLLIHASNTRLWTVAWSPDGTRVASGGDSGIVQVWRVSDGKVLTTYAGHLQSHALSHYIKAIAWSPDGQYIASGSDDQTVHIWNATTGTKTITYTGHIEVLNAVSWSPDGKYVASGSGDRTAQVWRPTSGEMLYTYHGHSLALHAVPWSPDSTRIASASDDTYVKVWQAV